MLNLAEEMAERPHGGVSIRTLGQVLWIVVYAFLASGQRERAEKMMNEIKDMAERTKQAYFLLVSMSHDIILFTMDGKFEEAIDLGRKLRLRGEELGSSPFAHVLAALTGLRPMLYLDRVEEFLQDVLQDKENPEYRAISLAQLKQDDKVKAILEKYVSSRSHLDPRICNHRLLHRAGKADSRRLR